MGGLLRKSQLPNPLNNDDDPDFAASQLESPPPPLEIY